MRVHEDPKGVRPEVPRSLPLDLFALALGALFYFLFDLPIYVMQMFVPYWSRVIVHHWVLGPMMPFAKFLVAFPYPAPRQAAYAVIRWYQSTATD
ncbi:MAG: hypothetical protein ABL912_01850 [Novosphingobium sp.]